MQLKRTHRHPDAVGRSVHDLIPPARIKRYPLYSLDDQLHQNRRLQRRLRLPTGKLYHLRRFLRG